MDSTKSGFKQWQDSSKPKYHRPPKGDRSEGYKLNKYAKIGFGVICILSFIKNALNNKFKGKPTCLKIKSYIKSTKLD